MNGETGFLRGWLPLSVCPWLLQMNKQPSFHSGKLIVNAYICMYCDNSVWYQSSIIILLLLLLHLFFNNLYFPVIRVGLKGLWWYFIVLGANGSGIRSIRLVSWLGDPDGTRSVTCNRWYRSHGVAGFLLPNILTDLSLNADILSWFLFFLKYFLNFFSEKENWGDLGFLLSYLFADDFSVKQTAL